MDLTARPPSGRWRSAPSLQLQSLLEQTALFPLSPLRPPSCKMQMYQLQVDDLPPELWQHVLEHLTSADRRTCRLVSHAFHGLATSLVFSKLTVKFGDWDVWDYHDRNVLEDPDMLQKALKAEDESFEILECIAGNEWLAGTVKHLEVQAFQVYAESAIMARDAELTSRLTAALCSLKHLRSFVWHGEDPHPPLDLVVVLNNCCPQLQDLSLPMKCLPNLPLTAFRSLHSISVTSAEYTRELIEHTLSARHCTTPMPHLHTVQLPYTTPADIPISWLPSLTHLELVSMHSYAGLGALLRRLPQLRALALFSPVHDQEQIFAELASAKADVPHLAALALQGPSPRVTVMSPAELAQLCEFLHGRTALRRLYFTFEIATEGLPAYLKTIATLKNMEIFDLRMQDQFFDRAFLTSLTRCLPSTLSAMKLTTAGLLSDKDAFIDLWPYFTAMGFLYVRTWEDTTVSVDDVIRGASKLELVGYNGLFHDVQYNPDGLAVAAAPWSPRKTALRGMDDFKYEGWEWLMRHLTIEP